jgi:hypothetical protein
MRYSLMFHQTQRPVSWIWTIFKVLVGIVSKFLTLPNGLRLNYLTATFAPRGMHTICKNTFQNVKKIKKKSCVHVDILCSRTKVWEQGTFFVSSVKKSMLQYDYSQEFFSFFGRTHNILIFNETLFLRYNIRMYARFFLELFDFF